MSSLCFSLVLYKHSFEEIYPLLYSIRSLASVEPNRKIILCVYEASPFPFVPPSESELKAQLPNIDLNYQRGANLGFGVANNMNFFGTSLSGNDLFIVVNPDIRFSARKLLPLINWTLSSRDCACVAPLVILDDGSIQYSAKHDPTFLSLLLGRFTFLKRILFFRKYDEWHKNIHRNYASEEIACTYLSGCFLIIPVWAFVRVDGFSPRYFLHIEDADLVRRLSRVGLTLHKPTGVVVHGWARGSHTSLRQMLSLCKSYFVYCQVWGFKLL